MLQKWPAVEKMDVPAQIEAWRNLNSTAKPAAANSYGNMPTAMLDHLYKRKLKSVQIRTATELCLLQCVGVKPSLFSFSHWKCEQCHLGEAPPRKYKGDTLSSLRTGSSYSAVPLISLHNLSRDSFPVDNLSIGKIYTRLKTWTALANKAK